MSMKQPSAMTVACQCGAVALEAAGAPIASVACYCASCQEAGRRIDPLAGAPPVLGADGGTAYVLYRKDRVRCARGGERLQAHRLRPDSPTRRMVASCCNSAMFLDFTKGHWLTLYRGRLPEAPPLEMRVMTAARREGVDLPADTPNYAGHSGRFMWKLLAAWAAMGFRAPKVQGAPD
jgi:hypothetical protein